VLQNADNKKAQMNTDNMVPFHPKTINPPNPFSLLFYRGKRAPKQNIPSLQLENPYPKQSLKIFNENSQVFSLTADNVYFNLARAKV
jgi:hypothetical protein